MKEDTVEAAVGDKFTAKIKNIKLDGSTQEIDCDFQIIKEATDSEKGEVKIGAGGSAINFNTSGN
ncbi:MAG: hypothetical protein RR531_13850, partial [Longicatena sp.]